MNWVTRHYLLLGGVLLVCAGAAFFLWNTSGESGGRAEVVIAHIEKDADAPEGLPNRYINEQFGFSFNFPDDFTVGQFPEGALAVVVLVQGETDFQARITPFDEAGPLTPERLRADIPDLAILNPQQVLIGGGTIPALVFGSENAAGETLEAWFIFQGLLIQVTAPAGTDTLVGPILETWRPL